MEDIQRNDNRAQRITPIIHTTSSSVSSTTIASPHSPTIDSQQDKENDYTLSISPLPSPLQHPISYIKQHLSPTASVFSENGTINSESYSGINLRRESNASSTRRSQNSMSLIDRIKFGRSISSDNEHDDEGLVNSSLINYLLL